MLLFRGAFDARTILRGLFRRAERRLCSLPIADIQEFYELTLLDETKSVQQKTAETLQMANKWETSNAPALIPTRYADPAPVIGHHQLSAASLSGFYAQPAVQATAVDVSPVPFSSSPSSFRVRAHCPSLA